MVLELDELEGEVFLGLKSGPNMFDVWMILAGEVRVRGGDEGDCDCFGTSLFVYWG